MSPRAERLTLLIGASALAVLFTGDWLTWLREGEYSQVGKDLGLYLDATASWLAGGPFYEPWQVSGPYVVVHGAILYPPPILVLLIPFTVLPNILWWAVPITALLAVLAHHRPRPIAWLGIAVCLAFPTTLIKLIAGNPVIWIAAFLSLGTVYGWPAVGVILKPTLAPFALVGFWRRSWWIALASSFVLCLCFLPMWPTYLEVVRNARDPFGPLYSMQEIPMMWIPLLAWLGGRHAPVRKSGQNAHPT